MADPLHRHKYGCFSCIDTGPPEGTRDYTTVVIIHGFGFSGAIFTSLIPFAVKNRIRLIFLNRRDYPGSTPYTDEERVVLSSSDQHADNTGSRLQTLRDYMKDRAAELFDYLCILVKEEDIPRAGPESGGIVLIGWSFGTNWVMALLANINSLAKRNPELRRYIKRLIFYDPPYHALGYAPPLDFYNPLQDLSLAPEERARVFAGWVSGYYTHGESPSELEYRTAAAEPRPTMLTMSPEFIRSALCRGPGEPGGSDACLLHEGIHHGLFASTRLDALYPTNFADEETVEWRDIELRYLWCDRSVWEMPWCAWSLSAEVEQARSDGKHMRGIHIVRVRGVNHFAHWDDPEKALAAFLEEKLNVV